MLQLVIGSQKFDGLLSQTIESVIPLGTKAFYEDADIQERFELAHKAGINTPEWANTPTLADMEKFFSLAYIYLGYQDDNVEKLRLIGRWNKPNLYGCCRGFYSRGCCDDWLCLIRLVQEVCRRRVWF